MHEQLRGPGLAEVETWLTDRRVTDRCFVAEPASTECRGDAGVYQLRVELPQRVEEGCGVAARFRLRDWDSVTYMAVGFTAADGGFEHVKVNHPRFDAWETLCWSFDDLAYLITHDFARPADQPIGDIRVWVKGTPAAGGARIDVDWAGGWAGTTPGSLTAIEDREAFRDRTAAVVDYVRRANPASDAQARSFLATGDYPAIGDVSLPWPPDSVEPQGWDRTTTFQYRFHSQVNTASLLVHAHDSGSAPALAAAREWVGDWLTHHGTRTTPDLRYAWYDHGVGERLITLCLLHALAQEAGYDPRFRRRILTAIEEHARLLESLGFYAYHQRTRHHNHAWFQDLALLIAAGLYDGEPVERWRAVAAERIADQVEHLFSIEDGYAVSVENSIGYHGAMGSFVASFEDLLPEQSAAWGLSALRDGIARFTRLLQYPDGRSPAQGDTFRGSRSDARGSLPVDDRTPGVVVLERSGYAVVRGRSAHGPWQLGMYATSLSETHKHADNLTLTLYGGGVEWLCDPSFYSHEYEAPIPAYLRGPWAHTQLVIPDAVYSLDPGLATLSGGQDGSGRFSLSGTHHAYAGLPVHRRVDGDLDSLDLVVRDLADTGTERPVVLAFHLGEGVRARPEEGRVVLTHPDSPARLILGVPDGEITLHSGWTGDPETSSVIGTTYEQYVESITVQVRCASATPLTWTMQLDS